MTEQERIESIKLNGGRHLKNFKEENVTYAMCLAAVEDDGYALYDVPYQFLCEEIYRAACYSQGTVLSLVPKDFIDKEICEIAVSSNGMALQYVPDKLKTLELCVKAVDNSPSALKFVPETILTPDMCAKLVKKRVELVKELPKSCRDTEHYSAIVDATPEALRFLPKKNRTADICKAALKMMGYSSTLEAIKDAPEIMGLLHSSLYDHESCLEFVTSEYFLSAVRIEPGQKEMEAYHNDSGLVIDGRTIVLKKLFSYYDVCEIAIKTNGELIGDVPRKIVSKDLCELAIRQSGDSFRMIPKEFRTKEICELAFEIKYWNFMDIPDEFKTPEMCKAAIEQSGYLLEYVPETMKTYELCMAALVELHPELKDKAIKNNHLQVSDISPEQQRKLDYDICFAAVQGNGSYLGYVPQQLKDYNMCLVAARNGFRIAKYIPKNLFSPEIALIITKKTDLDFEYIPKKCLTEEACIEAIKHGFDIKGTVIGEVPKELVTQEMCDLAIKISVWSLKGIPDEFVTEDILMHVAKTAPGRLQDNFPQRFRTEAFFKKMIEAYPDSEYYIDEYLRNE